MPLMSDDTRPTNPPDPSDEGAESELRQLYTRLPADVRRSMATLASAEGISMRDLIVAEHLAFLERYDAPESPLRGTLRAWAQQARERSGLGEPKQPD